MSTPPSERKDDEWRINVRIGRERMTLRIPRDPTTEKCLRNGATNAGSLVGQYTTAHPEASEEQILTYVALHLAYRLERLTDRDKADDTNNRIETIIEILDKLDDGEP